MTKRTNVTAITPAAPAPEIMPSAPDALPTARDFLEILGDVTRAAAGIALNPENNATTRTQAAAVAGTLAVKGIDAVERAADVHSEARRRAVSTFEPDSVVNPYTREPVFNPFQKVAFQEAKQLLERDASAAGLQTSPHKGGKSTNEKH